MQNSEGGARDRGQPGCSHNKLLIFQGRLAVGRPGLRPNLGHGMATIYRKKVLFSGK